MTSDMTMPKINTKKFKVLKFIGSHEGVKYSQIERFICELNGLDYDKKRVARRVINGKFCQISIRQHAGIWSTNLLYGRKSILKQYCFKTDSGLWVLNAEAAKNMSILSEWNKFTTSKDMPFKSVLEKVNYDDTIKGNSKIESVQTIQINVEPSPMLTKQDATSDRELIIAAVNDLDTLNMQKIQINNESYLLQVKLVKIQEQQNTLKKFISTKLGL